MFAFSQAPIGTMQYLIMSGFTHKVVESFVNVAMQSDHLEPHFNLRAAAI